MFISLVLSLIIFFQIYPQQLSIIPNYLPKQGFLPVQEAVSKAPIRIWENRSLGIETTATSVLVIDKKTKKILFAKNIKEKVPIASLTKLMSALVFLEHNPGWEQVIAMKRADEVGGARIRLGAGETIVLKDLFYSSLITSANNGIQALVRATGLSKEEFVSEMNKKARLLGLLDTSFIEPTGLSPNNISTAYDLAILAEYVFKQEDIKKALLLRDYIFQTQNTLRTVKVRNTDELLDSFLNNNDGYEITGGKTGFLTEAGYCLITQINHRNQEIITVILGSQDLESRFQEMKGIVVWTFENYEW